MSIAEAAFIHGGKPYRALFESYPVSVRVPGSRQWKRDHMNCIISVREILGKDDAVLAVGFYDEATGDCRGVKAWARVPYLDDILARACALKRKNKLSFCDRFKAQPCCDGTKKNMCELCKTVAALLGGTGLATETATE